MLLQYPPAPPGIEPSPFEGMLRFFFAYLVFVLAAVLILPERWRERVADVAFPRKMAGRSAC